MYNEDTILDVNVVDVMDYINGLSANDKARYEEKLSVVYADSGLDIVDTPDDKWKDFIVATS